MVLRSTYLGASPTPTLFLSRPQVKPTPDQANLGYGVSNGVEAQSCPLCPSPSPASIKQQSSFKHVI